MAAPPTRVTRRRFLLAAAAIATGVFAYRWRPDSDVSRYHARRVLLPAYVRGSRLLNRLWPPARRIRGHFPYLRFAPGTAERFVSDFQSTIGPMPAFSSDLYMRFLLSTDFFPHGADQTREIGYVTFYEPSVTPCYNLFGAATPEDPQA